MKIRVSLVMFAALVLSVYSSNAQIAVNGVEVDTKRTKSEVIARIGEPDQFFGNHKVLIFI